MDTLLENGEGIIDSITDTGEAVMLSVSDRLRRAGVEPKQTRAEAPSTCACPMPVSAGLLRSRGWQNT